MPGPLWTPTLERLHLISDGIAGLAYLAIPLIMAYFLSQRRDLPYLGVFFLFIGFILACSSTHLLAVWTYWHPNLWLWGGAKALTAGISVITAGVMVPVLPKALALPSPAQLEAANRELSREIAERRQVEAALRRSESRLAEAQRVARIGNWEYDLTSDTVTWSAELFQILNRDPALGEPSYTEHLQLYLPEDAAQLDQSVQRTIATGEHYRLRLRLPLADGGLRSIEVIGYADLNPANQVERLYGTAQDITAQVEVEQALRDSELRFRGIFDQMYQFIGLLTPDGILLEANRTALAFAGLRLEAVVGQPFWQTYWWQISPIAQDQLQEAIQRAAQGEFIRYEAQVQGRDRRIITIDFSLRPVVDAEGNVVLLIPEGRDISDRKLVEKHLELQALITQTMAEGICLIAATSSIIVYANPKFEQMFGYGAGELEGQHVSIINYQDQTMDGAVVAQELMAQIRSQGSYTYEIQTVKKDGTPFWCQATSSMFDHPDYGPVVVAVQQDITARKQADDQLRLSLKEKKVLLQEIHHRVKNNLQVIISLFRLQTRLMPDPVVASSLSESQNRLKAMALIHEKLYRSGNMVSVDLQSYVQDLAKSLFRSYGIDQDRITLAVSVPQPVQLTMDTAVPFGLIINELVSNALKYAFPDPARGTIQIRTMASPSHDLILVIADDGCGLPPNFDLGQSPHLGLSLVKDLVIQLGGQLRVFSQVGTCFEMHLPRIKFR